ncbi:MAG: sulfur carrier protein ThiS [Dehalococcoidia bacterium]|jgi:sulfur carrier protein
MISITVNGKRRDLESETDLTGFLSALDVDTRGVAVAYNGEVVARCRHAEVRLRDGDVVEIVRMVGGG